MKLEVRSQKSEGQNNATTDVQRGNLFQLFLLISSFFLFMPFLAHAELKIDVVGGYSEPLPIAVPAFSTKDESLKQMAEDMTNVIMKDLERSGLFRPLPQKSFIQTFESIDQVPRFKDWQILNALALVQGEMERSGDNVKVSFRLWDVFAGNQMEGKSLTTTQKDWRQISHIIADNIYQRVTGEDPYFNTRIVYISETGDKTKPIKRLAIMDQDGANHKFLSDGSYMVMTPRFSPNMQMVTFLSYHRNIPRVYLINLDTGKQEILGDFMGMTFAPRFSPDSQKVIMSMAIEGDSDIYEMNLKTRIVKRLTKNAAINTSPCYSPDGKKVVFNSDRGGSQQLYLMDADGKNVKRISFGQGRYATPVWSPRGDYIAFTKILGKEFYIGVMHPDGTGEKLLTKGYLVEAPTWAPNGRVLIYFKQKPSNSPTLGKGEFKLYTIDITGQNERAVPTPLDASDPAWSPLLQ